MNAIENLVSGMNFGDVVARFEGVTVEDVVAFMQRTSKKLKGEKPQAVAVSKPSTSSTSSTPSPSSKAPKVVNTRTPESREKYDAAILSFLSGRNELVGSSVIRKKCGGTPLQARTALNRLIEDKKVRYEGQARATVYGVAA